MQLPREEPCVSLPEFSPGGRGLRQKASRAMFVATSLAFHMQSI